MAFIVRVFGYRGISQLPQVNPKQYTADSAFQLTQPYEWRDHLTTNGTQAQSTAAQAAPDLTQIVRIEVPDGQVIRYELNPPGRAVAADQYSPTLSGINNFNYGPGWTLSIIDASGT